jgi:hypothetical protein
MPSAISWISENWIGFWSLCHYGDAPLMEYRSFSSVQSPSENLLGVLGPFTVCAEEGLDGLSEQWLWVLIRDQVLPD